MVVSKEELLKKENLELYRISKALADIGYYVKGVQKLMGTDHIEINAMGYCPHHDRCLDELRAEAGLEPV